MSRTSPFHLNLLVSGIGVDKGAWRLPESDPLAATSIDYYVQVSRLAESAKFDSIFLADTPELEADPRHRQVGALEPVVLSAALAVMTERIGLIATDSTAFKEPFNVARALGSSDHISRGRTGWNIVATPSESAAANFGVDSKQALGEHYLRADEFLEVSTKLWDAWDDDAEVGNKETGLHSPSDRVRQINHEGERFKVAGPSTVPRSPQAYPVLVQTDVAEGGRDFAARWAEVVFTAQETISAGQEFYNDVKRRAVSSGRSPEDILILSSVTPYLGSTEAEAKKREKAFSELDVKGGTRRFTGTPDQLADDMQIWVERGAADGFNLLLPAIPTDLETFIDDVLPILRERGLFREEYEGTTLREHYGLKRPANQFDRGPIAA